MMMKKKWAIAIFASLLMNVFLAGLLGTRLLGGGCSAKRAGPPYERAAQVRGHGEAQNKGARRKGGRERGPQDLILLRQMVKVMGGPQDPRVKELWKERRKNMQELRRGMAQARRGVQSALTKDPFESEELSSALSHLRDQSSAAQERAQEGVMSLAKMLTPKERAALRELSARRRKGRN